MSIQTREIPCRSGSLGIITLDSPDTLNALNASMFDQLQHQLDRWAGDPSIALVLLEAAGDRAFSCGGDLQELYRTLRGPSAEQGVTNIFAREYRVDYTLHHFPKPVVTLAQGFIFGGGMGLLQASRYRLITPDAVMAMPEAAIGLFPDVGAGWFLNRLPGSIGLFMGLTGARINASDAMRIGLADLTVNRSVRDDLIARISEQSWHGGAAADDSLLFRLLGQLEDTPVSRLPDSELERYERDIAKHCRRDELPKVIQRLIDSEPGNHWWNQCIDNLKAACPVSLWLLEQQLARGLQMSLKDILRMELTMVTHCASQPDLVEGIRALLIDRDNQPGWQYASLTEVPAEVIERYFEAPWAEGEDPLADL